MNPQEAFLDLLLAAMMDAATELKLTQLQTQLDPDGSGKLRKVRIIIVPETLEHQWPSSAPLGTPSK